MKVSPLKSALAAMFGVQSESNRQLDFNQPSVMPFIISGILVTAIFIILLLAVVTIITA
ncbi:DUF2970 domain-containing protein [Paraferrimonas sp. SM1919]|uniref:DUF2970 domain-containing protein n=1 Tax=Paraferrimonas sp. SM1919 TaxID=2662263 RepID=UPI0013D35100|nr:DUF2970 domain-containing protein [Paraferrimonas sp. SM1919]